MAEDLATLKKIAMMWKDAAPRLREMRHADIRRQDNAQAIGSLNSLFLHAIRENPARKSSGFVEMYRLLKRQSNG